MAEGCGASCAKVLLIIFNFIFWLSGAAILAIGIWILVDPNFGHYFNILETVDASGPLIKYAAYVLCGVGAFVFVVGFLGCCGAIKESRCLLGLYIFFLVLVMGGELAAGVVVLLYKGKVKEELKSTWQEKVKQKYGGNDEDDKAFTNAMDIFQVKLDCCGAVGPQDFAGSQWRVKEDAKGTAGLKLPYSCCVLKPEAKDKTNVTDADVADPQKCQQELDGAYHKTGCYDSAISWFDKHAIILIGVGIGIACLELFGFIFAVLLCRNATPRD
jgi:hypothetical protein